MRTVTVISQVEHGNTFTAYINGTNNYSYDIYCNSTDICKIACESSSACSKLQLHCFGSCFVLCDQDNGIDCPLSNNSHQWSEWIISTPSTIPSDVPSVIPSTVPPSIGSNSETTHMYKSTVSINDGTTAETTDNGDTHTNDGESSESIPSQIIIVVAVGVIVFIVCVGVLCCGVILVMIQRSKNSKERLRVREKEIEMKRVQTFIANPNLVKSISVHATTPRDHNIDINLQNLQANGRLQPTKQIKLGYSYLCC